MLALISPIAVLAFVLLAVFFAVRRKWYLATGLLAVSVLLNWWTESFAMHPFSAEMSLTRNVGTMRVMTYNTWCDSPYFEEHWDEGAKEMVSSVKDSNADVVVLNELNSGHFHQMIDTLKNLYPYNSKSYVHDSYMATQVFSRYPISEFDYMRYDDGSALSDMTWLASMTLTLPDSKSVRLFACHLAANQISNLLPDESVPFWNKAKQVYSSMRSAYKKRAVQAEAIRDSLDCCNIPALVVGDFNDVGGSYTLRHIKGNDMADAWWKGGLGYGATYDMHNLYLRLDHILYSKKDFKVKAVKVLNDWKYSDHYPIVADLELTAN